MTSPAPDPLSGARVTLGVTGSIAAYKAAHLLRLLKHAGAELEVILSEHATEFVGGATFEGLLGKPIYQNMFAGAPGEVHVELARRSDLLLIAPATADTLAKLASGRASDLLSATVLCAQCPVWIAPAMHPSMWAHPATIENVRRLQDNHGVRWIGPEFGKVASGDEGLGRMTEPEAIVQALRSGLQSGDLAGVRLVITAGPTEEPLDPVRFLGNRSSGKMGFALAEAARARGALVTLIAGPVKLAAPRGCHVVNVQTALEMQAALDQALHADLTGADAVIMAAAVADFRPSQVSSEKLKKASMPTLALTENPDLIATLANRRLTQAPVLVAFALETGTDAELLQQARHKLAAKKVDLVVANRAQEALGTPTNRAFLVTRDGETALPSMSKQDLSRPILDTLSQMLKAAKGTAP